MITMLVESAIRNMHDGREVIDPASIDWLDFTWLDCRKRFATKRTRSDREVRILLRLGQKLKHGDIVGHWPDGAAVVVNLLPADVLVIRCDSAAQWVQAAFQIGNLHLPMEMAGDNLVLPAGGDVEAMLSKYNIAYEVQSRRFQPTHWPDLVQLSENFQVIRTSDQ